MLHILTFHFALAAKTKLTTRSFAKLKAALVCNATAWAALLSDCHSFPTSKISCSSWISMPIRRRMMRGQRPAPTPSQIRWLRTTWKHQLATGSCNCRSRKSNFVPHQFSVISCSCFAFFAKFANTRMWILIDMDHWHCKLLCLLNPPIQHSKCRSTSSVWIFFILDFWILTKMQGCGSAFIFCESGSSSFS